MAPATAKAGPSSQKGAWRPTKIMNMRDLSRDDDFLSHLLVEKLGTGDVPLVVHKMDPTRRLPKSNADELLQIVRRMVSAKGSPLVAIRQAVDDILRLTAVRYYLTSSYYDPKQINAFATHASRYFELYLPGGSIEIAHTSRYSHRTGKSELCILATRPMCPGTVITELKGSMADLSEEEDKELKRTDEGNADGVGIRRDFSVIHSKQLKKNHLFLGPARFVNHDCDHNVELFREGRYITFRVIKMIGVGDEVTAHYGEGYFGRKNRHCLCATCEKHGRGGYGPQGSDDEHSDSGGSVHDAESDHGDLADSSASESESENDTVDVNERRTRRGVYAVMPKGEGSSQTEVELQAETASDLTSLPASHSSAISPLTNGHGLPTPEPEANLRGRGVSKGKGREITSPPTSAATTTHSRSSTAVPFKSVISTRAQKAREASRDASVSSSRGRRLDTSASALGRSISAARQLVTPPLTSDSTAPSAANSVRSSSRIRSALNTSSRLTTPTPAKDKGKGRATASVSDPHDFEKDEPETRHLRPRHSIPMFGQHGIYAKKPVDAPRGLDGKPLPTCMTCRNVLPVISVDSEVVWGLSIGRTGKRGRPKKNLEMECPRCIRHSAIYARKWPERIPGDGSLAFVPAPREITASISSDAHRVKRVNQGTLSSLNDTSKTATTAMVKKSHKRTLVAEQAEQPQPKKKQKIDNDHPRSHPVPKNKVGMSAKAKKILNVSPDGRRSGRTRVPSLKLRESEPPAALKLRMSSRKDVPTSPSLPMLDGESLDQVSYPAIPTTPTTPIASPTSPTSSEAKTPKSLAVLTQPRDANGRFGKKASTNGRFMRKHFSVGGKRYMKGAKVLKMRKLTRVPKTEAEDHNPFGDDFFLSEEAAYNDRLPLEGGHSDSSELSEVEFGEEALEDIILKRPHDTEEGEDSSSKRTRLADSEDELDYVSPTTSPKYTMGKGSLLRPNPISFARRKWAPVEDEDEDEEIRGHASRSVRSSTAEDTDPPVTPNDYADVGDPIDESAKMEVVDDCGVLEEPELLETELGPVAPVSVARLAVSTRVARLTVQPSPMNLARRRWAPPPPRFRDSENNKSGFRTSAPQPLAPALDVIVKVTKDSSLDSPAKELLGNLEWPSDSEASECYSDDLYSDDDDEEYYRLDSIAFRLARGVSPAGFESAADSENSVERLVNLESRSTTIETALPSPRPSHSTPPPSSTIIPLEKSPGYAWKRTVLMPTDSVVLRKPTIFPPPVTTSPTHLVNAGWDSQSSDIDV